MSAMTPTFFYLDAANQPQGPFEPRELHGFLQSQVITWETLIAEPGADDWLPMSTYADVIDAAAPPAKMPRVVTTTDSLMAAQQAKQAAQAAANPGLKAAGSGLQTLGVAVTLVNPIIGVGMIIAGSKVKKAGE